MDQAANLRKLVVENNQAKKTRTIAITSGKGGVGKTSLAVSLSIALAQRGSTVTLLDADLGLANINVVLGIIPKYNLYHVIKGKKKLKDIVMDIPEGIKIIAGASGISKDVKLAAKNFGLKGWLWWKKLILPGIFPFYTTGAMAAAGGCWNASIIAEFVQWGDSTIISLGLGSYITEYTHSGDFPRIALGIVVMCIYVIAFNRLLWQRLYDLAQTRFKME